MNLGTFHSRVSNAIRRGTSLDTIIPFWVGDAARILEQNYTFSWMRRSVEVPLLASDATNVILLDPLVKEVNWIKPVWNSQPDGTKWFGDPLTGCEEMDITSIDNCNPAGYWIDGDDTGTGYQINFDAIPTSDMIFRINRSVYTDWDFADGDTPALLARGQSALFFQTLILFANEQRDPRMAAQYGSMLQGGLGVLLRSEEDFKMKHQNDLQQQSVGGH